MLSYLGEEVISVPHKRSLLCSGLAKAEYIMHRSIKSRLICVMYAGGRIKM